MLKERTAIVAEIVSHLRPAEINLDLALSSLATLTGAIPLARGRAGLAMEAGHGAIAAFGEAQWLMIQARAKVIEGHRALAETQRAFRFPEVADGGLGDKDPKKHASIEERQPLRAVANG